LAAAAGTEEGSDQEVGNTGHILVNARVKRFIDSLAESFVQFFNFVFRL